tara:strand:- start:34342 stop:35001 length:660 start_codon:yes stop_codon:yes gene_type:complete
MKKLIKKINEIDFDSLECIIVNNGSTDNSSSIISKNIATRNSLFKLVNIKKNIGYGHGIMEGVKKSSGEIIAWTHADLQTDPNDVIDAYFSFHKNTKCVLKGKRVGRNFFDELFTFGMSILASRLMKVKLSDINAQPKMFHHNFVKKLENAPDDFSLDLFFLYQAKINGYNIIEYPVYFNKRKYGQSKGGGSLKGKIKLIMRTWTYMLDLSRKTSSVWK